MLLFLYSNNFFVCRFAKVELQMLSWFYKLYDDIFAVQWQYQALTVRAKQINYQWTHSILKTATITMKRTQWNRSSSNKNKTISSKHKNIESSNAKNTSNKIINSNYNSQSSNINSSSLTGKVITMGPSYGEIKLAHLVTFLYCISPIVWPRPSSHPSLLSPPSLPP